MECIAKAAISLDGFLDDSSSQRRIFSGPADRAAVLRLRSSVDAILIGATTLRYDDPSLTSERSTIVDAQPERKRFTSTRRVVISRSGDLPLNRKLFTGTSGAERPLIFCAASNCASLANSHRGVADVLPLVLGEEQLVEEVLPQLESRGVSRLLIEGGAKTLALFLASRKVSVLRLAVSPVLLGLKGRANLYHECAAIGFDFAELELVPGSIQQLDDLRVAEYRFPERS